MITRLPLTAALLAAAAVAHHAHADIMQGAPLTMSFASAAGSASVVVNWNQMTGLPDPYDRRNWGWQAWSGFSASAPQEVRASDGTLLGTLHSLHVEYANVLRSAAPGYDHDPFNPAIAGPKYGRTAQVDFVFESALDVNVSFSSSTTNTTNLPGSNGLSMGWGRYDFNTFLGWPPFWFTATASESASVLFTDLNGDGVSASGSLAGGATLNPFFSLPQGTRNSPLLAGPFVASAGGSAGASVVDAALDLITYGQRPEDHLFYVHSMSVQGGFNISAGDLAEIHSTTTVIPSPGALSLAFAALFTLPSRRRRSAQSSTHHGNTQSPTQHSI